MRRWANFLLAFAVGLSLVTAGTLVRYNQHTPITRATLTPGGHAELGDWRFSVRTPLEVTEMPGSSAGPGVDSFGTRLDQEGAAWLYVEIDAEPLPGIDFETASCSLELRAGQDRWDHTDFIESPYPTFCGYDEFPDEVGTVRTVAAYFQIPEYRLDDDPYVVVIVPGFPARSLAVRG